MPKTVEEYEQEIREAQRKPQSEGPSFIDSVVSNWEAAEQRREEVVSDAQKVVVYDLKVSFFSVFILVFKVWISILILAFITSLIIGAFWMSLGFVLMGLM